MYTTVNQKKEMKKLTLKLIETGEKPKIGDLTIHPKEGVSIATKLDGNSVFMSNTKEGLLISESFKVVLPYGLSDKEIKVGDLAYDKVYNRIVKILSIKNNFVSIESSKDGLTLSNISNLKKVELLPEHFNYQQLVELGLKDGESFKADIYRVHGYPKWRISRFTPDLLKVADKQKTYTEEVYNLKQRCRANYINEDEVLGAAFRYLKNSPDSSIETAMNEAYRYIRSK